MQSIPCKSNAIMPKRFICSLLIQYTFDFALDTEFSDARNYSCHESYLLRDEIFRIFL